MIKPNAEPAATRKGQMSKTTRARHELVNGTLYREKKGIIGRCTCGWTTGYRFSSFIASAFFQDHQEDAKPRVKP